MTPRKSARNVELVRRRMAGESFAAIARDLSMREERVREVYNVNADPGATCAPSGVSVIQEGDKWIAEGHGSRATGRTADIAVSRWHSARAQSKRAAEHREQQERRKAEAKAEMLAAKARIVPPREPWPLRPIQFSAAFHVVAERARACQKPMGNMGSRVPEGGSL